MLSFWRAIFYSSLLDPIFTAVASALGVTKQVCKEYCTSGVMEYGLTMLLIVLAVILVIVLIRVFGLLNGGNLSGKYNPESLEKVKNSPLAGKNIVFLGSSVTKGFAAYGKSFVDMIAARTGATCVKEAVSGTTLVDDNAKSYVARLKALDPKTPCDLFVCQLSTNDATKKKPLGKVAVAGEAYDTKTICGAIEYIIDYAKKTWNCPIAFYTNPEYASPEYKDMVEALYAIAKKWDVAVIDLWNDRELNTKEAKKHTCMNDQIHPTKKGYALWTPVMEAALGNVVEGKAVPARPKTEPAVTREEVAKKKSGRTTKKVILRILAAILAIIIVVGASTVQQLFAVTGMKNEGNSDTYNPENVTMKADSPIKGKKLLWLGSSVFQGFGSGKTSPALYIDALDGTISTIEVKGGTFLASIDGSIGGGVAGSISADSSYINRLRNHTAETDPDLDLVVVQLSTNDSKGQCETGVVSDGFDPATFDEVTTTGALEAIIAYAKETWGARVLVITGTYFEDEMTYSGGQNAEIYKTMIERCHELDEKWGDDFTVLDLWHNDAMYENVKTGDALWRSYMSDAIHPTKKGYLEWWGPYIEAQLYEMLAD